MKFLLVLFLASFSLSFAQLSTYDINGYAKYLFSSAKYPTKSKGYNDHLLHARLNTHWYPHENFRAVMEMRLRGYYGESVENIPRFIDQIKGNYDYLNLNAVLWEENKSIGYGEIDRLYLDWNYNKLQLTLGRQRIAWGTSWAWNPIDIFNPLSVLDFDYEERPAVDAFRAQYYTGPVSKIEFAFKPGKEKKDVIAAGLISFNNGVYDFNFIGGIKSNRWFGGTAWVGDILGAGFRGEFLLSEGRQVFMPELNPYLGTYDLLYQYGDDYFFSIVLSGDYTFHNSFYIHTEILHNKSGVTKLTALYQRNALDFGMLTAARWSIYQELAYDIHPLLRGTVFGIFNPDDKSFAIVPSISYSVITNLDLLLLTMFFNGDLLTEFGGYGSTVFIRCKYSF